MPQREQPRALDSAGRGESMSTQITPMECPVCLVAHSDALHAATLRVRLHLRETLQRKLDAIPAFQPNKPLRQKMTGVRNTMPTARDVRKPRKSEIAKKTRRVREPRAVKSTVDRPFAARETSWNRRLDEITVEAIVECWQQGMDMNAMAAKWSCHRSAVSKRIIDARKCLDFRLIEAELLYCACGNRKRQYGRVCCACACKEREAAKPKQRHGGHNRKVSITVEDIFGRWQRGMTGMEIAAELNCSPSLITKRMREARRTHPEVAAEYEQSQKCRCGRVKRSGSPDCKRCANNRHKRNKRAGGVSGTQIDCSWPAEAVTNLQDISVEAGVTG